MKTKIREPKKDPGKKGGKIDLKPAGTPNPKSAPLDADSEDDNGRVQPDTGQTPINNPPH